MSIPKFLEAARSQINKGIYVWGGDGEDLNSMQEPEEWIERRETSTTNAARAITNGLRTTLIPFVLSIARGSSTGV